MSLDLLWKRLCAPLVLLTLLLTARIADAAEQGTLVLQDFLRRNWTNEVVRFPLSEEQLKSAERLALTDSQGRSVPHQIDSQQRIAFQASLQPFERVEYRLQSGQPNQATDLVIEEDDNSIRLLNRHTGVSIRKRLAQGEGPLAGVRLTSGKWAGDSELVNDKTLKVYSAKLTARGPVFAEAVCRAEFGDSGSWEFRVRLEANEPVVVVDEEFSLGSNASFVVKLSNADFTPDHLLYRNFLGNGPLTTEKIEGAEPAFIWEPWLHWWGNRHGTWFGLYSEATPDLLSVAACDPSLWVTSAPPRTAQVLIPLKREGDDLKLTLPLNSGRRRWILCPLAKDPSLAMLKDANLFRAPPAQQYLIKHGNFPLDLVKDYVLQWSGEEQPHPRLFVTREQVSRIRAEFKPDPAILETLRQTPFTQYAMNQQIHYYVGTGDAQLGKHIAQTAKTWVQDTVDMLVQQNRIGSLGFAPHQQTEILSSLNLADVVWTSEFTPEDRQRVQSQVAFIAYTVQRPDYWAPEKGFSANPNMTTAVAAFQLATAAMIPSHPNARGWMEKAMHEFKNVEFDTWADSNGGWLEAPHYAMVSYDYLIAAFLMSHNLGLNEYLYDPKMKKICEWFAKISTPPDSRTGGRRHFPALGNSMLGEPSGEFAIMAALWKDKDPEFAANMQWMQQQHGPFHEPVPGGFTPMLAGYRSVLVDPTIVAKAPQYQSELFPETGVILRNQFPSDRETQLHLIAGRNHDHYDNDSGSITLWGKGRIVADDFGYQGFMPPEDHNMVSVGAGASPHWLMHVKEFTAGPQIDYVRGQKESWQRQIVFVKDSDPLGPNYFVIRDSFPKPEPATWRLWLAAKEVQPNARGALAIGLEDVDTDIFFVEPSRVSTTVETKTRECPGMNEKLEFVGISRTQLGLIATLNDVAGLTTVIYPRLKSESPPVFTTIADGKGVKVSSAAGVDYVFLSDQPFQLREGDVEFAGTVGAVQIRAGKPTLSLGAKGKLTVGEQILER